MALIRIVGVSFLLFFISCGDTSDVNAEKTKVHSIDDVNLYTMNNEPIDMQQYKGKTVFINFWATWCKPCIREMPSIQNAMEILKDKEIVFLFATNDELQLVKTFQEENSFDFNYVLVKNQEELNIGALPTTHIYASDGTLSFSETGFRKWDNQKSINQVLKIYGSNDN